MNTNNIHNSSYGYIRRLRICLLLLCGLILAEASIAQIPDHTQPFAPDSIKTARKNRNYVPEKRFGRAALQLGLAEVLPALYNRYLKKADYAYVSIESIKTNLNPKSWQFDADPFPTNQIAHPWHGSIYFNSFRSNGYSFWQSVPAVFAGSYLWETFGETERPSPNDFINTSFAGIMLGEVIHRISEKIHNSHRKGFWKTTGEVFSTLINPADGMNRIIDGQWGKTPWYAQKGDLPKITMDFDLGLRNYSVNNTNPFFAGGGGIYGRIKLNYGSPGKEYKTPFSNFSVVTEFGKDDSSGLNIVSVQGSITGWKLNAVRNTHLALISANYDYIRNESFFYSGENIRMTLLSEYDLPRKVRLNTYLGAGPIILSAIPNEFREYSQRNYDFGMGAIVTAGGVLNLNNRLSYNIRYSNSWSRTINGSSTNYRLSTFTNELTLRLVKTLALSAESGYFKLTGHYPDHPTLVRSYPYIRLSARYGISL